MNTCTDNTRANCLVKEVNRAGVVNTGPPSFFLFFGLLDADKLNQDVESIKSANQQ